jgi:hypothetical protein
MEKGKFLNLPGPELRHVGRPARSITSNTMLISPQDLYLFILNFNTADGSGHAV